jgi:hypothetical protein
MILDISTQQLVVISMRANPKPLNTFFYGNAKRPIRDTNANTAKRCAFDVLEME